MAVKRANFADPDYEPTDEDLRELSREAFADVARKNRSEEHTSELQSRT